MILNPDTPLTNATKTNDTNGRVVYIRATQPERSPICGPFIVSNRIYSLEGC